MERWSNIHSTTQIMNITFYLQITMKIIVYFGIKLINIIK